MRTSAIAFVLSLGAVLCLGSACGRSGAALSQDAAAQVDVAIDSVGNLRGGSTGGTGSGASTGVAGIGGSTVGTSGMAGAGGTGSGGVRSLSGGSLATGGLGGGGTTVTGGGTQNGVNLIARYDGTLQATWQNHTSQSIFVSGCGTVGWSRLEGSGWVYYGPFVLCDTEGVGIEVPAGGSFILPYTKPRPDTWTVAGTYRLDGDYSVGCTVGLPLSQAGCRPSIHVTSNELVVPGDGGVASDSAAADASSSLAPQCLTKNGAAGWGQSEQDLICTAGCSGCTATCLHIGTWSEGWYAKCDAVDASGGAGCGSNPSSGLIKYASCSTGTSRDGGSGAADIYSGCQYIGGFDRLGVIKTNATSGFCTVLILRDGGSTKDLGLTISSGWTVEAAATWPASAGACATRTPPAGAIQALSGTGTVTVRMGSSKPSLDIDAVLTFPVGDSGASQSETLQAQAVAPTSGC